MGAFGTTVKVVLGIFTGCVIISTPFLIVGGVAAVKAARESDEQEAEDKLRWEATDRMEREQLERDRLARERANRDDVASQRHTGKFVDIPSSG